MIDLLSFTLQLFGHPAVSVSGELTHKLLNTVLKISFPFLFPERFLFGSVVIAAPGKFHRFAPPPDVSDSALSFSLLNR
jgi:hypothetical protein